MKRNAMIDGKFQQTLKQLFRRRPTRKAHRQRKHRFQPAIELLENRQMFAASYLAPAEPAGSVNVKLDPLANVAAGVQEIVTFGVPFTRGSLSQSQLSQVRVLKNGVEIPAFVEQLTPWRSINDAGIDGQSVRVARIQIPYTFSALNAETITVQWGGPARTLNRATMQDPRLEWHPVTSGTFVAGDNVEEPDVLPLLPKEYMAKGMFDARTQPTAGGVAETRDDPAAMDAMNFTGYTEFDYAQKNFFYTTINQNPGITVNYKTDPEPWLYDRSSGMYELYLRSGFGTALREAIRSADFYADHLDASGFFTLKPGDPKYSYNEPLAYTYWLLGDNRMLAPISTVVNAFNGTATHWTPNLSFWTERNVGDKLLATEVAYEVTGNATFKTNVQTIVNDLIWHQNGAGGQLPANRVDGGLYHIGEQHDASEVDDPNVLIASSWMSALIVDPMVRAYGVWQNPQIADFIVRMGNFEKAASKTDADGQFGGSARYPDYLMRTDGTSENRTDTDVQHAMDVGAVAAWATYFAELRGTPDASLRQLANDLYATYDAGVNFWTRPGGTNFNVSPPRRYTWEYKNSPSFSWALTGSDAPGQPGVLQFNAAGYNVTENQASAMITVTRTGGSAGNVTVNYATTIGTATAGADYAAASGTLTFADGETSKTFTVPMINDSAVENAETVTLTLSNPTGGAALSSPATATLTIESDDASNQPITVTLQQGVNGYAGTTDANISTQYAQYTGGNGTTTIDGSQMGVYQTTGDSGYSVEGLIRFADLGIPANATVSGATLTLSVDTWTANPTIRGYYVLAPWTTTPGSDLGWVHRGTGQNWATPGALGQGSDVVAGKSFVLPGITASGTQTITVNLDAAVLQSWLNNPSANQGILLVNETPGAVVRVNASENATAAVRPKLSVTYTVGVATPQPGALQFSNATYAVNENGGTATITVTRTGGSDGSVSVNYATSNGTATAGSDYSAATGTLTFAADETSKSFTVPIANDTVFEGNETINLTLSSPTGGATLGSQSTAGLTIQDDDVAGQPGALQFNASSYSLTENGGTLTVTVTRTGGTSGAVAVQYATSNGTAAAGSDYTAASGTLTFANGEASKTFTVAVLDDSTVEGSETLTLTLSNPTGGATLGSPASATFTIVDNDSSTGVVLPAGFTQSVVATGISSGTALSVAPDGRIFVLEQGGAVRVIKNGSLLAAPAFTVTTIAEQERGLLGITFDPNFTTNHFVYVYYTVGGPSPAAAHNRVSRFTLNGDVAVAGSESILIDLPDTTYRIHNSGALKFGADGKLYVTVGNDVTFNNSQDLTNPFGKILRINSDGTIPADNPFYYQTTGVNRAIWARGLRNPYTLDVQPGTGLMYINDVGEAAWEEINQGVAGANYGWPNSEGYTSNPQYQSPVYAYGHGAGASQGFAIVGGAFYNPTNATFPSQYVGKYFFMDYVNGWISYIDPASPNPKTPTSFATNIPTRYDGGPVDLEVGADGALYYLNRLGGGVFKIQAAAAVGAFTKVNGPSGVDAIIAQKYQEDPNWWLTGQHLVDLDNDGDLDLFLDAHGGTSVVALNDGHGAFTRVTAGSWPSSEIHQMVDINGDGKVDLSVTYQDGGAQWWINNSTPGTVNFTATNVTRGGNTSRAQVLIDFNGDGKVDWLRSEQPGLVIDFGNGAGGFTAGSLSFPIADTTTNNNANFLPGDFDDDGDIDLLVLTGGGYDNTLGKTAYWRNNGNLTFTDITASVGLPASGTVAKGVGDFDQDGDIDLIAIENKAMPPVIYINNGQGVFAKKAGAISGVAAGTLDYSAWGTAVSTDFDNDGVADIIMNGKYYLKVLRGTGGGNFTYMNTAWGIRDTAASAVDDGLCFGDIDSDGDLDVIGFNETFPTRTLNVYRNDLAPKNWLNVRPVGLAGDKAEAGAKISIYAAGTNQLLWFEQVANYDFQVATSYYGYGETERHFGLGNRASVDVVMEFYGSGRVTRINNVAANQTIRVLESAGTLESDFDHDGVVGPGDLAVWRGAFGVGNGGDANGDNRTDGFDLLAWQRQLGQQSAVPAIEPALAAVTTTAESEARVKDAAHDRFWGTFGAPAELSNQRGLKELRFRPTSRRSR